MAELGPQDRLQPSLLDRLTDEEPHKKVESRDRRDLSVKRLREAVLRDLAWLLNTENLTATQDLEDYPLVAGSVLNYGIPVMAGHSLSGSDLKRNERLIQEAVLAFEPRILRDTLKVHVNVRDDKMSRNAMSFDIEGELWAQPMPLHLLVRSRLDLETGDVKITEGGSR